MLASKRSRSPCPRGWDDSWNWLRLYLLFWVKAWQKELVHKQLLQNCSAKKKSLKIQFFLWIRLKMQVRNWPPNSSDHGLQSTWGQPNLNHLGSESVFTSYLSFLVSVFSCLPFTPFINAHLQVCYLETERERKGLWTLPFYLLMTLVNGSGGIKKCLKQLAQMI